MLEQIILGAIQGVTEWVPVSSKTCVILTKIYLFNSRATLNELIQYALFLHLGTFFAAVVYFWKDIVKIVNAAIFPKQADEDGRKILIFLITTTILTGLGLLLTDKASGLAHGARHAKAALMSIIAALLIVTGYLQIKMKRTGRRTPKDLNVLDGILLGLAQAIATLPGLSRAGTTMAALSFRNFDKEHTLKLSFLMSLPVIFIGNIVKNYHAIFSFGPQWIGAITAFIIGLVSIGALMQLARRMNFGAFLIFIGAILGLATMFGFVD
jgi:undecaprenyl-diphosphatase